MDNGFSKFRLLNRGINRILNSNIKEGSKTLFGVVMILKPFRAQ